MGGRRSIVWTEEDRSALSDAIEYVAQDSVKAAIRLDKELRVDHPRFRKSVARDSGFAIDYWRT